MDGVVPDRSEKKEKAMIKMKKLSAGGSTFWHVALEINGKSYDFFGNKYGIKGEYVVQASIGSGRGETLQEALARAIKNATSNLNQEAAA